MRLWHYKLIDVLPRQQLLGQWRELNSIFKKQDKHVLINYIYDYPKQDLCMYANAVTDEMFNRNYKIGSYENYKQYFKEEPWIAKTIYKPFAKEHDNEYLTICYYNLKEKYIRGAITEEEWQKIENRYKEIMK